MGRLIVVVVAVLALLLLAGPLGGSALLIGAVVGIQAAIEEDQQQSSAACITDTPVVSGTSVSVASLTEAQTQAAHTIWTIAHRLNMGDRAAVVGIVTSMQESNLGTNTTDTNVGRDVGPFQQRSLPGWYGPHQTQAENITWLSNMSNAAEVFFTGRDENGIPGLDDIDGWEGMPVTRAAQSVQRSAFPDAYAKHEPAATALVAQFVAEGNQGGDAAAALGPNPILCDPVSATGPVADCPDSRKPAERGLTPDGVRVLRCAAQQWPDLIYGGVGPRPANVDDDHQTGRAVDIMTPGRCSPVGKQIADWARSNQASLGVKYVIWCDEIWSVARDGEGWRPYGNPNGRSDTLAHRDHVHISVFGNRAGENAAQVGTGTAVSPTRGPLTARFGQRGGAWSSGMHTGLDFAPPAGTPIYATRAGTVTVAGPGGAYGTYARVDHGGGVESLYAHMQTVTVRAGQQVTAGQTIGTVGWSGNVRPPGPLGAHLHFEVRQGGSPVDPETWLRTQGVSVSR